MVKMEPPSRLDAFAEIEAHVVIDDWNEVHAHIDGVFVDNISLLDHADPLWCQIGARIAVAAAKCQDFCDEVAERDDVQWRGRGPDAVPMLDRAA